MKPGARRKGQNTVKDAITEAAKTAQKEAGKTVDKAEAAEAKAKAEKEAKAAEAKAKAEEEAKAAEEQAKHQEELEEQEYQRRFAKHRDELKWLYTEVYQNDWMFEELCEQMHRFYKERRKGLKTLDRQREADPEWYKKNDMMGMMLSMPLISLFLGFTFPAAVGLYWAFSSLVAGAMQITVQHFYSPQNLLAEAQAKLILSRSREESERISSK